MNCAFGYVLQILLCAAVVKDVPVVLGGGVGPGQWGNIASMLVLVRVLEGDAPLFVVAEFLCSV